MRRSIISFLFATLAIPLCADEIDHALFSAYAIDMRTGEVLIDKHSALSLATGSCMKIATTGAALSLLGEKAQLETHLEYDGFIDDQKTLKGNLYVRGSGDPCLGSDRVAGNLGWKEQLAAWATAVQALGIEKIEGRVIGDDSLWEESRAAPQWAWEDIGNYYGAGASALTFHENRYFLYFKPGSQVGEETQIVKTDPPMLSLSLKNEVKTGPEGSGDRACIYGSELASAQTVLGTIPAAVDTFAIQGAMPDPVRVCEDLLVDALAARGIIAQNKSLPKKEKRERFHTTLSPHIGAISYWTNQRSINLYAEHLLKKMGESLANEGSTRSGVKVVTEFWKKQGIDLAGFHMTDGSGLSRTNLATTKQLVQMLMKIKHSPIYSTFLASLPQHSENVRAKSGSMSLVRGTVGYAGDIAFAILINHCSDPKAMNAAIEKTIAQLTKRISDSSNP